LIKHQCEVLLFCRLPRGPETLQVWPCNHKSLIAIFIPETWIRMQPCERVSPAVRGRGSVHNGLLLRFVFHNNNINSIGGLHAILSHSRGRWWSFEPTPRPGGATATLTQGTDYRLPVNRHRPLGRDLERGRLCGVVRSIVVSVTDRRRGKGAL